MDPTANQSENAESAQGGRPAEASPERQLPAEDARSTGRSQGRSWLLALAAALTLGSLFGPIASGALNKPNR